MSREIKIFLKKNYILLLFLIITIAVIVIFSDIKVWTIFSNDIFSFLIHPDVNTDEYKLLSIFNEISIGYIISFIFYFITQYLYFRRLANIDFNKCKSEIDKLYRNLIEFIEFRQFIKSYNEKYIENGIVLSTNHIYTSLYLEKNTNYEKDGYKRKLFVTNENDYFINIAKSIVDSTNIILSKYNNLDDDIKNKISSISNNIIFRYFTDNIYPEDKYMVNLVFSESKGKKNIEDCILFLGNLLGYKLPFSVKFNFVERKQYMEDTKLFRFKLPAHLMVLSEKYMEQNINENYYLYSDSYVDKDEISLANKNLVGYLEIIDFNLSIIIEFKNKLLQFGKKIIDSALLFKDKNLDIYYINYLQLKYRLNYGYDSDDVEFLNSLLKKNTLYKFCAFVLLRNAEKAELFYSKLSTDDIKAINDCAIYPIYLKLNNHYL